MSLRTHTTHDNRPSNLIVAQWNRARVMNARGNSTDRIVGRKLIKETYVLFVNTFSHFAISVLNMPYKYALPYCCRKQINSYETNVIKQMLRTSRFCHVNILIHNFFQFFGVYFYRSILRYTWLDYHYHYGTGEHEHNTVHMLCSLKQLPYYKSFLPITATSQQGPLSSVPKVAIVERFDCTQNVQNINVLIS